MIQGKHNLVWTPDGIKIGPVNSLAGKGESIVNFNQGKASLITEGVKGQDTIPTSVKPSDDNFIAGNTIDWRDGLTFADKAAPATASIEETNNQLNNIKNNSKGYLSSLYKNTVRVAEKNADAANKDKFDYLADLSNQQGMQNQYKEMANNMANCGKSIPTYAAGKAWLPGIVGVGNSLLQMHHWLSEPVRYNSTYAQNPYENRVLEGLGGLRQNLYPQQRAIYDAERRGAYGLSNMGGLTSGQRAANRVALALGSGRNMADAIAQNQAANIGLRTNYYKTMGELGQQNRAARMNANQFDRQDFVAAHGAKTKGIETAMANLQQQIGNWYKNDFKYDTWQDTLNLYRQQLDQNQQQLLRQYEESRANRDAQLQITRMNNGGFVFTPNQMVRIFGPNPSYWPNIK